MLPNKNDTEEVRKWCESQGFVFVDAFFQEPKGWIRVYYRVNNNLESVSILLRASETIVYPH